MILLALPTTVFAKELGLLTITVPGIKGELTLTGPDQWGKLEDTGFFAPENFIRQAPENLEQGYTLTASLNLDGKIVPYIEMVYYPTEVGKPGYFHVTGRIDGQSLRPVDEWGVISLQADQAFRALMSANNVAVQSAVTLPDAQSASSSPAPASPTWALYSALALITALAAALILIRRGVSQRSA
jgi:hypothetical protein